MKLMHEDKIVGFSLYTGGEKAQKPISVTVATGPPEQSSWMGGMIRGSRGYSKCKKTREAEEKVERLKEESPYPLEPRVLVGLGLDRAWVNVPRAEFDEFVAACIRVQTELDQHKIQVRMHREKLMAARRNL